MNPNGEAVLLILAIDEHRLSQLNHFKSCFGHGSPRLSPGGRSLPW